MGYTHRHREEPHHALGRNHFPWRGFLTLAVLFVLFAIVYAAAHWWPKLIIWIQTADRWACLTC